jgi:proteasome lid subunit RPN8/RPN11
MKRYSTAIAFVIGTLVGLVAARARRWNQNHRTAPQPIPPAEPVAQDVDADAGADRSAHDAEKTFVPTSRHQGDDWADLRFGPNRTVEKPQALAPTRAAMSTRFVLEPEVAQKFNAYAVAAWPSEIGGLLKIDESEPGVVRAVDIKIFSHKVANGTYWEADPLDVARFTMELDMAGRGDEIAQWRCLIHSHPNMQPFLSGTDRENIVRLAGQTNAWSVICAAKANPDENWFAVHYAQAGPVPLVMRDLPVDDDGGKLSGTDMLSETVIDGIRSEVDVAFEGIRPKSQPHLTGNKFSAAAPAPGMSDDHLMSWEGWDAFTDEDLQQIPGIVSRETWLREWL